jgi:hypothetical protein
VSITSRSWLSFAAIGAGLIHLALAIGAPAPLAIALGALGFLEFGWGAITFAQPHVRAPRLAFAAALAPVLAWGAALLLSGLFDSTQLARSLPLVPLAIAALLELVVAGILAMQLRRDRWAGDSVAPSPGLARTVAGTLVAAVVIAALTLVALAGTPAGLRGFPVPGGTPSFESPDHPVH